MIIRLEQPKDWREVENLTREAFWDAYRPGCLEHYVLNQYRKNPAFIPELDFVMEENGPISIHPDCKRKGYGLKLLQYALEKAQPEAFAAYDAGFPPKEKHLAPGQLPRFCRSCGLPLSKEARDSERWG